MDPWLRMIPKGLVALALMLALATCTGGPGDPAQEPDQQPTPAPPKKQIVMQDDANVVPPSAVLTNVTETTVTFAERVQYKPGDVLIIQPGAQAPRGLVRKVETVSADGHELTTSQAALGDVIESGTIEYSGPLIRSDTQSRFAAVIAGPDDSVQVIGMCPTLGNSVTCTFPKVAFENADGVGLVVDGSLKIEVDVETFRFDFGRRGDFPHLEYGRGVFAVKETTNLRVQFAADVLSNVTKTITSKNLEIELFRVPLPPILLGPAGWINPIITIFAGIDGVGYVSVDVTHSGSITVGAQCSRAGNCHQPSGWRPIADQSGDFTVNEAAIGAEVRAYVRPEIGAAYLGLVGATVSADLYAVLGGEGVVEDRQFTGLMYLDAGIDGGVSIMLEGLGIARLATLRIASFPIIPASTIWEWQPDDTGSSGEPGEPGPQVCGPPLSPFSPSPPHNAVGVSRTPTLSWVGIGGCGNVTYDVYLSTSPTTPIRVASEIATNSYSIPTQLGAATTYYWKVRSKDSHGMIASSQDWVFETGS